MSAKPPLAIPSELLTIVASFAVTELIRTLQEKNLLTQDEAKAAVTRAAAQLDRVSVNATDVQKQAIVDLLLGRGYSNLPDRNQLN